jgi:TRAP-type C4-dicarboxylate transport system permease small subunit
MNDSDQPRAPADADTMIASFRVAEETIDLGRYRVEEWLALALFWSLAGIVFLQFFTRYALNDSAGWTEEIARYLLIASVFVGAAIGVRKNNHVHVDFLFHWLPKGVGRALAVIVDLIRILFLGYCTVLTGKLIDKIGSSRMSVIDLPMGLVYAFVLIGFALMTIRALQGALRDWNRGAGVLEQPELADADGAH